MRSMNPVMRDDVLLKERSFVSDSSSTMTLQGAVNRSISAVAICVIAAFISWQLSYNAAWMGPLMGVGVFGGLIVALVTIFKKSWAPITTPIYALFEGAALGAISNVFQAQYSGIVFQAVGLTFGVLFLMLTIYRTRLIRVTQRFRIAMTAAIGAIFLVYIVGFILSFFGMSIPLIHESGPIGIIFSLVVVGVASFSLLLNFDSIEKGASANLPKYMEWYCAFGLLVTLIWLYLEILNLLSKLQRR
jgi:uncharacterized YccA/Bax inhibitor family protein